MEAKFVSPHRQLGQCRHMAEFRSRLAQSHGRNRESHHVSKPFEHSPWHWNTRQFSAEQVGFSTPEYHTVHLVYSLLFEI